MWIFSKNGFVSAVRDSENPDLILVRARAVEDADNFAGIAVGTGSRRPTIEVTPDRDYRFRFRIDRVGFRRILAHLAENLDYTNFKDAAHFTQPGILRARTYAAVWSEMHRFQEGACRKPKAAPDEVDHEPHPYGYCPQCGRPGSTRERRVNGNDTCRKGHTYPSKDAINPPY